MPSSETTCRLCTKPSYSIKFWVTLASQPFFPPKQKSLSTHHSGSPWLECFFVFTLFFFCCSRPRVRVSDKKNLDKQCNGLYIIYLKHLAL